MSMPKDSPRALETASETSVPGPVSSIEVSAPRALLSAPQALANTELQRLPASSPVPMSASLRKQTASIPGAASASKMKI